MDDAANAHDRAVLASVRIEVVLEIPQLSWMSRRLRFDLPLEDRLPCFDYAAELRHDTHCHVFKHLVDRFSQVRFHRNAIDAGQPRVDIAIAQICIEVTESD